MNLPSEQKLFLRQFSSNEYLLANRLFLLNDNNMLPQSKQQQPLATVEGLLAIPEDRRFHEILNGELIRKASPSFEHGDAQSALAMEMKRFFQRRSGGHHPGGWWILTEVEVQLALDQIIRPDVVGWHRERVPERPAGIPIPIRPDWICEILSPSNFRKDLIVKKHLYHKFRVPYYWIVDPTYQMLTVYRYTEAAYLEIVTASRGDWVRAEPFEAISLPVGSLFGDDDEAELIH